MEHGQTERLIVESPLYLFSVAQPCYSCGQETRATAIATTNLIDPECDDPRGMKGEVCLLSNVASLPNELLRVIQTRHSQYQSRYSRTAGQCYMMMVCQCGAHQGDHYAHRALFDAACNAPQSIDVEKMELEGRWELDCGYSTSSAYDPLIAAKDA